MSDRDSAHRPLPPIRYPHWLTALSWGFGLTVAVFVVAASDGFEGATFGERVIAGFMLIAVNAGYFVAPLIAGRNAVSSFLAALLLLVSVSGWVSLFVPDAFDAAGRTFPWSMLLALGGLAVLIGGALVVFGHFRRLYA